MILYHKCCVKYHESHDFAFPDFCLFVFFLAVFGTKYAYALYPIKTRNLNVSLDSSILKFGLTDNIYKWACKISKLPLNRHAVGKKMT